MIETQSVGEMNDAEDIFFVNKTALVNCFSHLSIRKHSLVPSYKMGFFLLHHCKFESLGLCLLVGQLTNQHKIG